MKRLKRKIYPIEIHYKNCSEFFDAIDDSIKFSFRINDEEYDFICDNASDEEIELFTKSIYTFNEKRLLSKFLDKYIE
jgi:hypothetical protein